MSEQVYSLTTLSDPRARRRIFLDIALRRAQPGAGSLISLLEQSREGQTWPDLTSILSGIPWAVVGGVATRTYMPERATQNVDILIAHVHADQTYARLRAAGYIDRQNLSIGRTTWQSPGSTLLDVVESREPWVLEALAQVQTDPQGLPVLSSPYLALMKVQASRTQDLADLSRMLGLASADERQATWRVFSRWHPGALEDLESLISLGELEIAAGDGHSAENTS